MTNEQKFESLLLKYFNNVNKFSMVKFSSSEIYRNTDTAEVKIVFEEIYQITFSHLLIRNDHKEILNELTHKIGSIKSQKDIDELTSTFSELYACCHSITPKFFNMFEVFDRELESFSKMG